MKSVCEYVELQPNAKSAFNAEKHWRDIAYHTWRCSCSEPKVDYKGGIDIVVSNSKRNMVVDFLFGFTGFGIIAKDFLENLGRHGFQAAFDIGIVRSSDGNTMKEFVTFRAKNGPVYVRGGERSPRRICPECGRLLLGAVGEIYLCGLDCNDTMLQSTFGSLLLRSDFFEEKLQNLVLPNVRLRHLAVRNFSSDGLPVSIEEAKLSLKT